MITHLGFTGSRQGITMPQHEALREIMDDPHWDWFHHGDCWGADQEAHSLALLYGLRICIHPPDKDQFRAFCRDAYLMAPPKPYLVRDQDIVDACGLLVACPSEQVGEKRRSGTWATVRMARTANKPIVIIRPDGTQERER